MKIEEIMTKDVITVDGESEIQKVISLMESRGIKELPVTDFKRRLIGMVTIYDLMDLVKVTGKIKIKSLMFFPPTLKKDADVEDAVKLMVETGLEAIPVIDENYKVIGIVSDYDVLKVYLGLPIFKKVVVKDIMKKEFQCLNEEETIGKARRIMNFYRIDRVPVLDKNGKVIGLILSIDIFRKFFISPEKIGKKDAVGRLDAIMNYPVKGIMRTITENVYEDDKLSTAVDLLLKKGLKGIHVLNRKGNVVGLLLRRDILLRIVKREAIQKGIITEFSGLKLDAQTYQASLELIRSRTRRILDFLKSAKMKIHIKSMGKKNRYVINLKLIKPGFSLAIKEVGFNILSTIDSLLDKTEDLLRKKFK
ncbi:MAG: CBS domain-containing protein [Candidatus Parvarchaeota archaeon]|nr:CBS domain-containing protein [Candidatus Jingweiarchaeum tengchongense]MCW1298562.1 CBS domain-containing protein [Candidatus Jingweiarchaeum tengchongense]MCW1304585.1 CBS domain-containing protein [Candidatus Jingweiarchaeum tengchongense]MCW1309178.1 CBS domain-containing protein [Candidatus Jingweiarchaeum tengchongense]MCW1310257.1 CBS domain-containing protein [Candidatus Jingweiarchaeum tengchongense]